MLCGQRQRMVIGAPFLILPPIYTKPTLNPFPPLNSHSLSLGVEKNSFKKKNPPLSPLMMDGGLKLGFGIGMEIMDSSMRGKLAPCLSSGCISGERGENIGPCRFRYTSVEFKSCGRTVWSAHS